MPAPLAVNPRGFLCQCVCVVAPWGHPAYDLVPSQWWITVPQGTGARRHVIRTQNK